MTDKSDLAALLGSRICHDLISPIGAIGNGVELLMLESRDQGPEMALISDSVAQAIARIRFFRIALGAASPGQRIGRPEGAEVLAGLTRGGRLVIDWQGPAEMARAEAVALSNELAAERDTVAALGREAEGARAALEGVSAELAALKARDRLEALESGLIAEETVARISELEQVTEQLRREPRPYPELILAHRDSLFDYTYEDVVIKGYDPHPAIKAPVAV